MKNVICLMEEFEQKEYIELLERIYVDKQMVPYQNARYIEALRRYNELFGSGDVEIYSAPGRSEVGGNHTDHQQGKVLAASVNLDAIAVAGRNEDSCIEIVSDGYKRIHVALNDLEPNDVDAGTSGALIRGVASGLKQKGYQLGGFCAYITSDILIGAGLSSSAAFETILGTIISGLFNQMQIPMPEIAKIGQYAENVYFKKPCGLMDQMASAVGGLIHIDFADAQNPVVDKLDVDFEAFAYSLCIVDTKGSHAKLTDDYAAIPQEMKQVASYYGKTVLREVDEELFYKQIPEIRSQMGDRCILRAIHFFEEDKRVEEQVSALKEGDLQSFLKSVKSSGDSSFKYLQNVYTNKDVENQAVSIVLAVSERVLGEHGVSRVHGGGFAGTIQAFVGDAFVQQYKERMDGIFGKDSCHILRIREYGGVKVI